jgi:hypothetical protein
MKERFRSIVDLRLESKPQFNSAPARKNPMLGMNDTRSKEQDPKTQRVEWREGESGGNKRWRREQAGR